MEQKQELIDVLKFTPRTYKVQLWGYGGEYVMGTVERKIYDYFKHRRLSIMDFAWDSDYADSNNIPEEMWPFPPGSWYECDDMGHCSGADRSAGTLQVLDENDEVVFEKSLDDIDGCEGGPEWGGGDEVWIDSKPPGTVVFIGVSNEKGTFFEGEFELSAPFNIEKMELGYDEIDGNEIVNSIYYDGEEVENFGGSTNGKSSDMMMCIAGTYKDGKFETYKDKDSISYSMTDWFTGKQQPVREGIYEVKTKDGYEYQAMWNGSKWTNTWNDEEEIKVKQWRGIDHDPDAE